MQRVLSTDDVMGLLHELKWAVSKETCWSCDCLQGSVAQLELDAGKGVTRPAAQMSLRSDNGEVRMRDRSPLPRFYARHLGGRSAPWISLRTGIL